MMEGRTYRETEASNSFTGNTQCENQVAENPNQHQVGSESLVAVIHAAFILLFGLDIGL